MSNLGNTWRARLSENVLQQERDAAAKKHQEQQAEADRLIQKIPALIEDAAKKNQDTINVLGRHLVGSDVACGNVDSFITNVGHCPILSKQLAGAARIVFDWCDANGLVCETKMIRVSFDHEYDLIARPK